MGVHSHAAQNNVSDAVSAGMRLEVFQKIQTGENAKQHGERIAACLLRITHVKCIHAQKRSSDKARAHAKHSASKHVDSGNSSQAKKRRQRPDEPFAATEVQPFAEQEVIERHVGFAAPQNAHEVIPVEPGNAHARAFIKPEAFCGQNMKAEHSARGRDCRQQCDDEHR